MKVPMQAYNNWYRRMCRNQTLKLFIDIWTINVDTANKTVHLVCSHIRLIIKKQTGFVRVTEYSQGKPKNQYTLNAGILLINRHSIRNNEFYVYAFERIRLGCEN